MDRHIEQLKKTYSLIKPEIVERLKNFEKVRKEKDIFYELIFCLLTPQSKAKLCWQCVENLKNKNLLCKGKKKLILKELNKVRFKNKKTEYIISAINTFLKNGKVYNIKSKISKFKNVYEIREWLVKNVKGLGYKEASHFLRNIGIGKDFAILDRHILKNLKLFGVIGKIPDSLTKKKYYEIEKKMKNFSKNVKIPISHLDLLLWFKETGEIFK